MTYGQHWITELAGKPVDPPIHVRWSDVDPTAPDPDPEPTPEPEPERPVRGLLTPLTSDLRALTGKHVPPAGGTIEQAKGGYISIQNDGCTVRDYWRPAELGEATGDGIRVDAIDHDVVDVTIEHVEIGQRLNPAPGKHIDGLQILGLNGHRVGGIIRIAHSWFGPAASSTIFAGKNCLLPGTLIDIDNIGVDAVNHGIRMYAPDDGRCTFRARRSTLAKVSLVGDWDIDVDDESMPPGGIGRV